MACSVPQYNKPNARSVCGRLVHYIYAGRSSLRTNTQHIPTLARNTDWPRSGYTWTTNTIAVQSQTITKSKHYAWWNSRVNNTTNKLYATGRGFVSPLGCVPHTFLPVGKTQLETEKIWKLGMNLIGWVALTTFMGALHLMGCGLTQAWPTQRRSPIAVITKGNSICQ